MSTLIPDGARSPRRCIAQGCARVPAPDTLICDVHAQALRPACGAMHLAAGRPGRATVEQACTSLVSSLEVIGVRGRLAFKMTALQALQMPDAGAMAAFWTAVHELCDAIDARAEVDL